MCAFYFAIECPRYYLKKEIEWITNWGGFFHWKLRGKAVFFLLRIGGIPGTILHKNFLFYNNQSHTFSAMVLCRHSGAHRRRVTQTRGGKEKFIFRVFVKGLLLLFIHLSLLFGRSEASDGHFFDAWKFLNFYAQEEIVTQTRGGKNNLSSGYYCEGSAGSSLEMNWIKILDEVFLKENGLTIGAILVISWILDWAGEY